MKTASEIISQIIQKKDQEKKINLIILWKNWKKILGPTLASMAKPIGSKDNTLIIGVEDSILMQELSFFSSEILEKINDFLGFQPFDKVKYKLLEDKTPLDAIICKREGKRASYIFQLPEKIGELKEIIPEGSPVYKAYKSYIKLIAHIKNFKEE